MPQIVECVPNFSEGRDRRVIDAITAEITKIPGAVLLDVDPGEATNRTVVTFVGVPEAVLEAAFRAIAKAAEVIDMSKHRGEHPRMGATDVCPFIPVANITMDECVALAKRLGERVGSELAIPVYLYEYAASCLERKNLADVRKGEYESLPTRVGDPFWKPDFGPDGFNSRSGATAIGARDFLIAYNVNLNTRDKKNAATIAQRIREQGWPQRDENGKIIRDAEGSPIMTPGAFKAVKAVGWYIEEYRQAQVSINLVNYKVSPPHIVFDECCRLADELGFRVTGSELVGLIPLDAMLQAGCYYLKKQGKITGVGEDELVRMAILSLGLDQLSPFDAQQKIIEYRIRRPGRLVSLPVRQFVEATASDSPAPGGGSVAALCGALAAALVSMVANLTHGRKAYLQHNDMMEAIANRAQDLKARLVELIDRDTEAFDCVMAAMALPKKTDEQKAERDYRIQITTQKAASVPFETLSLMPEIAQLARTAAEIGNTNLTSDAGVAGLAVALAAHGAAYNVFINIQNLNDREYIEKTKTETKTLLAKVDAITAEVKAIVEERLFQVRGMKRDVIFV
ncbi:MAG: glutamate formimidoyltransferase [Calditrichaeota bacterium]|nr:glutamate formimidoyltransferase [Calditrichota bacterium]